jgi:DNA polymerase
VEAVDTLKQIADEVRICRNCKLCELRKLSVPGEGPANAEIMFIGEGPGYNENEQGRPFVGAAGKFLEELLAKAYLKRTDVFICNVVKCRPPDNRDPEPDEIIACGKYLDRQIEAINPRVIVTLGRFSMAKFFPNARISQIHGQGSRVNGKLVVAMYHPAAALHQPALRTDLEKDFAGLDRFLHPDKYAQMKPSTPEPVRAAAPAPLPVQPARPAPSPFASTIIPAKEPEKPEEDQPTQLSLF